MEKEIKNLYIKMMILPLVLSSTLLSGTYDERYSVLDSKKAQEKNVNTFMDGNFEEIIRFDDILFAENRVDDASKKTVDEVIGQIKKYAKGGKVLKVTLIGHTDKATDNQNEQKIDSDTYANRIQNMFRYSLNENNSTSISKDYANALKKRLVDSDISKNILFVEQRGGEDLAFSGNESEDRDLSNRVMVTIYVEEPVDIDSDRDGVFDNLDRCPNTPRLSKVDKYGCPIDSDRDGVLDYKDRCAKTPKGVKVDRNGCPIDSDGDGIVDYKDKCQDTEGGFSVDPNGCPLKSTLKLYFNPRSDQIKVGSNDEIKRFAKFMRENKLYKAKITGHTDSVGKAVTNMKLSQRRAHATKVALITEGVEPSRLTTAGRGELDPIESNRLKEGRSANRRIEVELFY
ncbi:MAG: OmpA family protein [Campylobacterota bacterium]